MSIFAAAGGAGMDIYELEEWMKARKRGDAVLVAIRASLRVWPIWGAAMRKPLARKHNLNNLAFFWLLCFAGVARKGLTARAFTLDQTEFSSRARVLENSWRFLTNDDFWFFAGVSADEAASAVFSPHYRTALMSFQSSLEVAGVLEYSIVHEDFVESLWDAVSEDVALLNDQKSLLDAPLWHRDAPPIIQTSELEALEILAIETGSQNSFWHRWYFAAKRGEWLDWELQKAVALLPEEVWKRPPAEIEQEIAKIEAELLARANPFQQELDALPAAPKKQVQAVQAAMERNRQALPPTFDAIEGLLLLEIERMRQSNDRDAAWERQMWVYLSLYDAVRGLREALPSAGPVTIEQAEKSERLLRLYMRKFGELPRAKVDEVCNGFWDTGKGILQAGLIGTTALLGMSYGLPAMAGLAIGSMIFAPKNATDLIKSVREALPKP